MTTLARRLNAFDATMKSPANSAIGLVILLTGLPAWWFWSRTGTRSERL